MAKRTKTTAAGDDHLPLEIRREILTRLPVKSILRFRSVCKSWYSLVSCPNFISDNSVRNLNKNPSRALLHLYPSVRYRQNAACSFRSHDKSFMESREHDEIPESFLGFGTSVVGSCNGLICLEKVTKDGWDRVIDLVIWNPTIRKIVELPSIRHSRYPSYLGFGFDSKTSDYKVLSCSDVVCGDSLHRVFQIFDLRKCVWRDTSPHDPNLWHEKMGRYPDCYFNGAVYWSGFGILFSFNFSDECFREMNLPDCAKYVYSGDGSRITTKSVAFGGLIHVIVFIRLENGPAVMSRSCSVWAMKEYDVTESWTKVYDIDLQSARVLPSTHVSPWQFLLWENDEVLMVHYLICGEDLVLYNTGSRKSKCVFSFPRSRFVLSCPTFTRSLWLYEESLVLMS